MLQEVSPKNSKAVNYSNAHCVCVCGTLTGLFYNITVPGHRITLLVQLTFRPKIVFN